MGKIAALLGVLKSGTEIADKARGKAGALTVNYIVVFISACIALLNTFSCSWCSFNLSNEQLITISSSIMAIIGLFNNVATAATSSSASINPVTSVKILMNKQVKPIDPELVKQIRESNEK